MFKLSTIINFVERYVKIISEMIDVDVEVVDHNFERIAGTGIFTKRYERVNKKIYKEVMETGKRQIMDNPVDDSISNTCRISGCENNFEISIPIILDKKIIGVIGMMSNTKDSREEIKSNLKKYLDFLEQVAEFISLKASEKKEDMNKQAMVSMLEIIIRNMDEGAIIIDNDGRVNTINRSAKKQLGINRIISNEDIKIEPTGDTVSNSKEYRVRIGRNVNTVIGDVFDIPQNPEYDKVLLFRDMKQVQSNIYAMTSIINAKSIENIIGTSEKTEELKRDIIKVADSTSTVLVTGESGTGKEMVATAIWQNSDRANKRFVAINCAAIPEALLESELFGYVKGAFTGADPNGRIGKFELANNGVIFLDEIGDMPLYLQSKLLRVIQDRKVTRIGSNQVIPLNVRIIAATNKSLRDMITENKFREDLYYRLNVIPIDIPPLRERKGDIEELIYHFLHYYRKQFSKNFYKIEEDALNILINYSWPGNVRELENAVEYMVNMMEGGIITIHSIPRNIVQSNKKHSKYTENIVPLAHLEKNEISKAISYYGNTTEGKRKAAKALGIGIATLYRKI
ncbi:sigma-54-dependent Fis family transcriptional regulator [Miniphocaeibacter massiliensis]|uniref:sigma-54-dependent Fis family transcriptional regulator n=1 Tax=Miniphocaeibacter massiliensis TaxID=2041841 RepID=UPI001A93A62F|nr:sigma 54-interacting transcriptional regulator [Miniphocaeibacter massiliensis]